ncbi:MATE family efflux transporter [Romboutsia sp. 1001216sp1]|uniref:MATE family efflux transporter n=1 Tax=Romboutsia sp. 1001216sp1 TaxID=2986997 RepID=UPI00232B8898|nr:MATE family efflux transporter [Romboutsia sp. 1001216sp1]MDB8804265.1 MATE family efflux transporter [Romboutsia sp. 1001216sp1]MDB8807777.1 MATE family efflux transporter [Romboutsia sp. 1001216sp1]MDB8809911.1 MATE family efflux transporter [Romboutsia sp. 1001216sp1]MDB8815661.1 MATE family efflux transporter [Romboutsia sp. 1001216sp1]MDB8819491.1 MATE family efflux transporter [Romboutsia sp. 1001216sp1]
MKDKESVFLNSDINKLFYKYLINSVLGMLAVSFCILADTMFIGQGIGSDGLAALNICIPIFNLFNGLGLLFGMGGATALSISRGKGEIVESQRIFTKSIIIAILVGITLSTLGKIFTEKIGYILGANISNIYMVKEYLSGVLIFSFSYILAHTTSAFIRNDHNPRLAMIATVTSGLSNVILDYLLIFIFDMGIKGAGLATSIASLINLLILLTHFISKKCSLRFIKFKINVKDISRILFNGLPSFIVEISSGIVIFIFNLKLLNIVGNIGVSAYSIIANVSLVAAAIFTGISQAMQPIISVNYGANKIDRVKRVRKKGLKTSIIVGLSFYIIGILFPQFIVGVFTSEKGQIVDITVNAIRYYFLAFIFMGINIVNGAYYQSMEHRILSNVISLSRGIILIIIGITILPIFLGVNGVWLSAVFAEVLTLIITYIYVYKKK